MSVSLEIFPFLRSQFEKHHGEKKNSFEKWFYNNKLKKIWLA